MVPACQQTDTVRSYQGTAIFVTGFYNLLFQQGTLVRFLTETSRDNDKCTHLLFLCQEFHVLRTETCCHHQDGKICCRQLLHIMENLDTLNLILLRIHHTQDTLISSIQDISDYRTARLMNIIRTTDNNNTFRL